MRSRIHRYIRYVDNWPQIPSNQIYDKKIFELTGINAIKEIEFEVKEEIADTIANLLAREFEKLNYREVKAKLLKTPMYIAEVPKQYYGVVFLHDNSTIYIDSKIDILDLSERVIHEFIHAIQIVKDKKNNIQKVGVCEFNEFKATGIGLNEAAVQYITSKIANKEYKYVEKYEVVAKTYNEERYPLMCNLILQLIYVTGENVFLDSILNSKEDFEYKIMENCGEGVYITIVNGLDKMLYAEEENIQLFQLLEKYKQTSNANTDYTVTEQEVYKTMAKIETNRKAIKDTYIKLENLILNSYFNKYFSRIETLDDIITYRKDLYNYKEIYGMNSFDNEYNKYYANKIKELEEKRINIMRKSGQFSLVKTDNKILNIFSKIRATLLKLFKRNIEKEENR